ncbi:MAG: DUF6074 family protein [Rhizobiaceae bacterium]
MGDIVVFPLSRRISLVRETAELIRKKQPEAASRFWKLTVRRLWAEMQVRGLAEHEIELEVGAFADAVMEVHTDGLWQGGGAA